MIWWIMFTLFDWFHSSIRVTCTKLGVPIVFFHQIITLVHWWKLHLHFHYPTLLSAECLRNLFKSVMMSGCIHFDFLGWCLFFPFFYFDNVHVIFASSILQSYSKQKMQIWWIKNLIIKNKHLLSGLCNSLAFESIWFGKHEILFTCGDEIDNIDFESSS